MILYRDLYQRTTLANKECNSTTGDMTVSINEMQDRTASDIIVQAQSQVDEQDVCIVHLDLLLVCILVCLIY